MGIRALAGSLALTLVSSLGLLVAPVGTPAAAADTPRPSRSRSSRTPRATA